MITPVLLCGGSGTRLWPLSRRSYPKQFAKLGENGTLFQASARRFVGPGFERPLIVTQSDFRFIVTEQLTDAGIDPGAILLEPAPRNTAPAILAAALYLQKQDKDAVLLVAPSDHVIPDGAAFQEAVLRGVDAVGEERIVTFGIAPDRAETGYGYLELARPTDDAGSPIPLTRFIEKPSLSEAQAMLDAGTFLWNAGIFLARATDLIAAFQHHAPTLMEPVAQALEQAKPDLGFLRLAAEHWAKAEDISVDYAVMEKAPDLVVVPYHHKWSDLGNWRAVWRADTPDGHGVVEKGDALAIDCSDTLLRSEAAGVQVVGLGLSGITAVATRDAVLIADTSRSQDVGLAVAALKDQGKPQATGFPRDHRPWGWFDRLVAGPGFQVKRITVHPGAALSMQSHQHRAEHWVVVQGTAKVTIDEDTQILCENQSAYVPQNIRHRLENPGDLDLVLIEVQTGEYLGEDDIIRHEDRYARD